MPQPSTRAPKRYGARAYPVDLGQFLNWPKQTAGEDGPQGLATTVGAYPAGEQQARGIPFRLGPESGPRVVLLDSGAPVLRVDIGRQADYLCVLHHWHQRGVEKTWDPPREGLVLGEYRFFYGSGDLHVHPIRARFEVSVSRAQSPPWLAVPFGAPVTADPTVPSSDTAWGYAQCGLRRDLELRQPNLFLCAIPNPQPGRRIGRLEVHWFDESSYILAGLTLYSGAGHPLRDLPRRSYRVTGSSGLPPIARVAVDMGLVARMEHTQGPPDKAWLESPYVGLSPGNWVRGGREPERNGEDLIEIVGTEDASVRVELRGRKRPLLFSLGEAFHEGESRSGAAHLEVVGATRQWMKVRIVDGDTGGPTPARVHFAGSRGEYLAPYGHHSEVNPNWFEDYGADLVIGGRNFAYVPGEFSTELPTGEVYVEICKGFEYEPIRRKVKIRPGQKDLELSIPRWSNWRADGWVTADTHVHFISPQTAWLEAQCEGVNVVHLLASQWGRLFTNVGDLTGRVGAVEDDTVVFVGTENRNHMLGHMSMLGTRGAPVYPMCGGGPRESWVGDPDYMTLTEWAEMNRAAGGLVIRPHFPMCGNTEDPVPIIRGLVDALEIRISGEHAPDIPDWYVGSDFFVQEWYRYLNCGYRVAAVGGTDKMAATSAVGWLRTYAKLDSREPFSYDAWTEAVRAGRTVTTTGPLMDLTVEGRGMGESIRLPDRGGTVEVEAIGESFVPLGRLEIVCNGAVVAEKRSAKGARVLKLAARVPVRGSGWIAARCTALADHPGSYVAAHTSPVYLSCGDSRAFDGPAAQHMLGLVNGGMEYLLALATAFDDASRRRILGIFREAQIELEKRIASEGGGRPHHGSGPYHIHHPGASRDHSH